MSNKENDTFIENKKDQVFTAIEEYDFNEATKIANEVINAGFGRDGYKLLDAIYRAEDTGTDILGNALDLSKEAKEMAL